MNRINLSIYADEINQFLNEARLKNIDFDKDNNLSMKERGVARGVYSDTDTSSGSSAGETSTMNIDFNNKQQQATEQKTDASENPQPSSETQEPQQSEQEPQQSEQEPQSSDNSAELEKLQLSYKKILNLQKKFAAFKKQCEASEMTVEDVIKSAQGGSEQPTQENQSQPPQEQTAENA